jgi:hypothetical protein
MTIARWCLEYSISRLEVPDPSVTSDEVVEYAIAEEGLVFVTPEYRFANY